MAGPGWEAIILWGSAFIIFWQGALVIRYVHNALMQEMQPVYWTMVPGFMGTARRRKFEGKPRYQCVTMCNYI